MNAELLARFDALIKGLEGKSYGIVHDSDPDGTTSAVLASHAIKILHNLEPTFVKAQGGGALGEDIIQLVQEKPVDLLITLDKPIDQRPDRVEQITKYTNILCIDHHTINKDLQSEKVTFIKAHFLDHPKPSAYPTAKMAYDLFSRVADIKQYDWIAAAGLIGDAAYPMWKDFVDDQLKKMNEPIPEDIFQSKLAKVSKLIGAGLVYDKKLAYKIYKTLLDAKDIDAFLTSSITKYEKDVQECMEKWISSYKENAEFHDGLNLMWYNIVPKFKIGSPVSTIISMKYLPETTVIVVQDFKEDDLKISFRRQDCKVDMAKMAKFCTDGLEDANGGGHIPAAGGRILRKDFDEFKRRAFKFLKIQNN